MGAEREERVLRFEVPRGAKMRRSLGCRGDWLVLRDYASDDEHSRSRYGGRRRGSRAGMAMADDGAAGADQSGRGPH